MTGQSSSESIRPAGPMVIYPAIDLLGGRCVRLRQGRYDQATVYHQDPLAVALQFREAGAQWLHVVDLDAARTGMPVHGELIAAIRRATGLKIQTGGGIRTFSHLRGLLEDQHIERVVLGTAAVSDRPFVEEAIRAYPDRVAIGIDAKNGEIRIDGWTHGSGLQAGEFARIMARSGARIAVFTDIGRDGTLEGPATDSIRNLVESSGMAIIASGGIRSEEDIEAVRKAGAAGVIIGKAIYERKVDLAKCLQRE